MAPLIISDVGLLSCPTPTPPQRIVAARKPAPSTTFSSSANTPRSHARPHAVQKNSSLFRNVLRPEKFRNSRNNRGGDITITAQARSSLPIRKLDPIRPRCPCMSAHPLEETMIRRLPRFRHRALLPHPRQNASGSSSGNIPEKTARHRRPYHPGSPPRFFAFKSPPTSAIRPQSFPAASAAPRAKPPSSKSFSTQHPLDEASRSSFHHLSELFSLTPKKFLLNLLAIARR